MGLRRFLVFVLVVAVELGAIGYFAISYFVYDELSHAEAHCGGRFGSSAPDAFSIDGIATAPYLMPDHEEVRFPSRDEGITISGWLVPVLPPDVGPAVEAPTVIVVHGLSSCKREPLNLLIAGMLHRNGFDVLLIDLRDHGESTIEDGRYAGGTEEYRDVLGAWDWLIRERGVTPGRIGLLGTSLGAATVLIAAGEEPFVAAVWEDSSYAEIDAAIRAELTRNGYPTILAPGGVLVARLVSGDDLTRPSPAGAVAKQDGRPIFITHGEADERVKIEWARDLAEVVRAHGGSVGLWIVPGAGHVEAARLHPDEYERRLAGFFGAALGGTP